MKRSEQQLQLLHYHTLKLVYAPIGTNLLGLSEVSKVNVVCKSLQAVGPAHGTHNGVRI